MHNSQQPRPPTLRVHCRRANVQVVDSSALSHTANLWQGRTASTVSSDLILRQLAGFPQPAVGVAVEPSPVKKWVQVNGAPTQLNAVLLQTPLQLQVLRLGRRHIKEASGPRYRPRTTGSSPIPTRSCPAVCW